MSLINCKIELRLRWTKHCVLSLLGYEIINNNANVDSNNIIVNIIDAKVYRPIIILPTTAYHNKTIIDVFFCLFKRR